MSIRPKEFHFPLAVRWDAGRRVEVRVRGKDALAVAPPVQFHGTDPSVWSPEDLFVGAAASCLAVTFTGIAERAGLAYTDLRVEADGTCGTRPDGRFGFTRVVLRLEVASDDEAKARELAEQAERSCLVAASMDVPVDLEITTYAVVPA
ncbi:MAG TPA: OsmC family protein [Gaiellaceae bacterium]|nr:OsmC family protein [Gaiellaceae bacterium]